MKKFILLALAFVLTLGATAQKKHDTTYVPVILIHKTDTLKGLNVYYVDSTTGVVKRSPGYELVTGLFSENYNKWITVKDSDIHYYRNFDSFDVKLNKKWLFIIVDPNNKNYIGTTPNSPVAPAPTRTPPKAAVTTPAPAATKPATVTTPVKPGK